ncbi:MAG: YHS domain-containing (seleno)protein [Verrucomicrobiota bacterium JB022]|nr:YHS domain-containing (seleno)protein [Verrucomicrobiota bacterium JB022]
MKFWHALSLFGVAALGYLLMASPAYAFKPVSAQELNERQIAIGGYDPVAYFKEGAAVKGSPLLTYQWLGATWYFRTHEYRRLFMADPTRYAPAYGGYCAFCMQAEREVQSAGDPTVFLVRNGRLYLLQDEETKALWEASPDVYIAQADARYEELLRQYREIVGGEGADSRRSAVATTLAAD